MASKYFNLDSYFASIKRLLSKMYNRKSLIYGLNNQE